MFIRECLQHRLANGETQVHVEATTGVALASGFYWYLKYYCNCSVTWGVNGSGNNLALPSV